MSTKKKDKEIEVQRVTIAAAAAEMQGSYIFLTINNQLNLYQSQ